MGQAECICWILVELVLTRQCYDGENEGGLERIKWNVSVTFWLNVVSTKRGHGCDDEGGLDLDGDGNEVLEITVVGTGSLVVSKLVLLVAFRV